MTVKQSSHQGFTLIELMIVVAIIGILAAIAVPSYQHYLVRSKISEGLAGAGEFKTAVAETFVFNGAFPSNNSAAGLSAAASYSSDYIASIAVGAAGIITVTFLTDVALEDASGDTLIFTPTDTGQKVTWTCTAGTLDTIYRPAKCRS